MRLKSAALGMPLQRNVRLLIQKKVKQEKIHSTWKKNAQECGSSRYALTWDQSVHQTEIADITDTVALLGAFVCLMMGYSVAQAQRHMLQRTILASK